MSAKSDSPTKMLFSILFISVLIHCLCGDDSNNIEMDCGHDNDRSCLIEADFVSTSTNKSVGVFVNCSNDSEISYNQDSKIDKIIWNGCQTPRNLKGFGLKKIGWKKQVKELIIENFAIVSLKPGTFDGFLGLEVLSFQYNSIQNLSSSCFRGLVNLKYLQMIESDLKWMDYGLLGDLPNLSNLDIQKSHHLLMGNHQFTENQILNNVKLEIYSIAMDLLEHFFLHVRNLSIIIKIKDDVDECDQTRLNGYEKNWIIEGLKLQNLRCGFILENVLSIKNLDLIQAIKLPYSEFELIELPHLETISLHQNTLKNFSSFKLEGNFNSLKSLDLSDNRLTGIDMRAFESLPSLKKINLNKNFLPKLDMMNLQKFENIQLFIDENNFDCSWLNEIASSKVFKNFSYKKNFTILNIAGLSCQHNLQFQECTLTDDTSFSPHLFEPESSSREWELSRLKEDNFVLAPEVLMIIVLAAFLLGLAVMFISLYVHHRRQILKQEPFYHLLRDSLVRPIYTASSTLRRDFKEIISRILPPTNYEHPISDSFVTEMTDVATNTSNIYEEIPAKPYQEIV